MAMLHILILTAGLVVLVSGLTSGLFKNRLPASEPMLAIAVGLLVGKHGLGWVQLEALGDPQAILGQVARLTVAVAVMAAAVRLPAGFFTSRRALGPILALGPGMLMMWGMTSLLAAVFFKVDV